MSAITTNKNNTDAKASYSCKEVMKILKVTRQSIYRLIKNEEFKATMSDLGYRIDKDDFDKWLDGREK